MEGFKFYIVFIILFGCKNLKGDFIKPVASVYLKDRYNNSSLLKSEKLNSFNDDLKNIYVINKTAFPICYSFVFDNDILVETNGNILKIKNKYYYSKINLISKYYKHT